MKPKINNTVFGSINIGGKTYDHDVIINPSGKIGKRKKKLSKSVFGTSHIISVDEAKYVYEKGMEYLIIGTGQSGMVTLSEEASRYFHKKEVKVEMLPTPEAIIKWNFTSKKAAGLFHVTC